MNDLSAVKKTFHEHFEGEPLLVRSPGRINLIGEHTDYNQGFVLPAAIDKAISFAIAPRKDTECRLIAQNLNEDFQFSLFNIRRSEKGWPNYFMGVVQQLLASHRQIRGFNCVFGGDIPIGAGMSSSAAIEAGLALALNCIFELRIDDIDLVKLAQKAENEFVGVRCGIMDQFINIFGEPDQALLLDCRSLEYSYYPIAHDIAVVLFDTCISHSLASSEYNRRREECGKGVEIIHDLYPAVTHLRDVTSEMLTRSKSSMDAIIYKRCKYVVEENDRVLKACSSLNLNDMRAFGRFMYGSHDGLSGEYEVSCKELDFLVSVVRDHPHVYGARMMGGGFGGCTINLIEPAAVDEISAIVSARYKTAFDREPKIYCTHIGPGTAIVGKETDENI